MGASTVFQRTAAEAGSTAQLLIDLDAGIITIYRDRALVELLVMYVCSLVAHPHDPGVASAA